MTSQVPQTLQFTAHNISLSCNRTVQYGTVQYSTVQYSTVQYSTVQYSTVQYSTVQYSTVQYSTVQYSAVQYSTVQCSTVQYRGLSYNTEQRQLFRSFVLMQVTQQADTGCFSKLNKWVQLQFVKLKELSLNECGSNLEWLWYIYIYIYIYIYTYSLHTAQSFLSS